MYFAIDNVIWMYPCDITRVPRIEETSLSGQTVDGMMYRDVSGTYFDYEVAMIPNPKQMKSYYTLYAKLTEAVGHHVCTFPFNNTTIQLNCKIEGLRDIYVKQPNGNAMWKGVAFKAVSNAPTYVTDGVAVVTRGLPQPPDIQDPQIGDTYTYTEDGWEKIE